MNPGKLDRRIVMQLRTLTRDGTGSPVETWVDAFTVCAEKVRQTGGEAPVADADRGSVNQQWRIRYRSIINAADYRIYYQSRFYQITNVSEEGRQSGMLIDSYALTAVS